MSHSATVFTPIVSEQLTASTASSASSHLAKTTDLRVAIIVIVIVIVICVGQGISTFIDTHGGCRFGGLRKGWTMFIPTTTVWLHILFVVQLILSVEDRHITSIIVLLVFLDGS